MFAFASDRGGSTDIFFQNADGSGEAKVLVATADNDFPHDWSDDGKYLIYSRCSRGQCDLWSLRYKEGQGAFEETPFIHSPFDEGSADFSPDGRFVVYSSDDSGRNEVYVQRFPDGTEKTQISTKGGANPRWRADGKELFYLEGTTLIAVPVSTTPDFKFGPATRLFEDKEAFTGRGRPYDVSPDGWRFVLPETLEQARQTIRIVQNWFGPFRSRQ